MSTRVMWQRSCGCVEQLAGQTDSIRRMLTHGPNKDTGVWQVGIDEEVTTEGEALEGILYTNCDFRKNLVF